MKISISKVQSFQDKILSWYQKNQRDLPWRKDRNPYHILISEVMSQQTQLARVVPKYEVWIERFPTLESLAKATTHDVLSYWIGLGYNRRALYLQKFAKAVVEKFEGVIPQDEKTLLTLPGIGPYTARALLCFAFDKQVVVIDTNIRKVILTQFLKNQHLDRLEEGKIVSEIAQKLLPKGKAYEWNQALMDYASAVLKKEKIAIYKQSQFKDSDRYYRGEIIRMLVKEKEISIKKINKVLQERVGSQSRLEKIIAGLVKDNMVKKTTNDTVLALL